MQPTLIQKEIHYLSLEVLLDARYLDEMIYADMHSNYYWSDDFSAAFYMAQAIAGFIAVTENYQGRELLLPEMQFDYALLHFDKLHCSKKVRKLIAKENLHITIDNNIEEIAQYIDNTHPNNWLSQNYANILRSTDGIDSNFQVITAYIEKDGLIVAGEIGYIIGNSYTSLSGFSNKDKQYNHYGMAQMVLLGRYLEAQGIGLWNLGQPYMAYKLALGAEVYDREKFLEYWSEAIEKPSPHVLL